MVWSCSNHVAYGHLFLHLQMAPNIMCYLFSNPQHPGWLVSICLQAVTYLRSFSLNTEQRTLIWTTCLSPRDGLNTRALLSILRLEILCSRQDQEPRAIQASDIVSLKVSISSTGYVLVVRGKRRTGGTNLKIRTTATRNFLFWPTTSWYPGHLFWLTKEQSKTDGNRLGRACSQFQCSQSLLRSYTTDTTDGQSLQQ